MRCLVAALLVATTTTLALALGKRVNVVFGFTGSTCAVIIMFLIPTASFLEVFSGHEEPAGSAGGDYEALNGDEEKSGRGLGLVGAARKEGRKIEDMSSCEKWSARLCFCGGFVIGVAW